MGKTLEQSAALDVQDIFVLRRVGENQLVNLDGVGRGAGWAGNITVDPERDPLVSRALAGPGVIRWSGESTRVFGPYWTNRAALTMVGDFIVVFGGGGVGDYDDAELIGQAGTIAWAAGEVSPEKRLADELEVTQAALAVASLPSRSRDEFLAGLAQTAADALACEFGAVVVREPDPRLIFAPEGWRPPVSDDLVLGALLQLIAEPSSGGLVVTQDLRETEDAGRPLGFAEGLVSRCIISLKADGVSGAIIVAHAAEAPRGFTMLCQQVAERIGSQASQVLTAGVRD